MADAKISALPTASALTGTEVLPIVQSGSTKKVVVDDLTVKNVRSKATTGILQIAGPGAGTVRTMTVPNADFTAARTDAAQTFTGVQTFSDSPIVPTAPSQDSSDKAASTAFVQTAIREFYGRVNDIGTAGGPGFGVGICPALPSGFSALLGTNYPLSDEYGNYQYSDGSIMVWIPAFYYKYGTGSNGLAVNEVSIKAEWEYPDVATANADGYALHRAFYDGGDIKRGFFIDKYLASKNGNTSCKSVANGVPISLTTNTGYTNSNGMTTSEGTCTGILADAVLLARSRGVGMFNVASVFMYSALALLSLAHAQASSNTTYCAWYDANNKNFPKGCNNGALGDVNDSGVTYTSAGDSGSSAKPKTGSGTPFAKTTHNGQNCGVADVNGVMWQVLLGVTNDGSSAVEIMQKGNGDVYVLKTSVALSSLTAGWNGTNDAWGDATNLATKYDLETGFLPWGSTVGWTSFGNGSNQVFSEATSGIGWKRTCCGVQDSTSGTSTTGTNQFGNDGCYQQNITNLFVRSMGTFGNGMYAGVFCRVWNFSRSSQEIAIGFRACAYGS